MTDEIKVRVGTLDDLDGMMALAMMATEENAVLSPDPGKLLADIYPALALEHGIIGIVGNPDGPIEGAVLLRVGPLWYSSFSALEEKAVFVHPDFRAAKGGRARKLCDFSKSVADALQLPLLIGVLSTERTAGKLKLYERLFGQPAGAFFLYGTKTGLTPETEH